MATLVVLKTSLSAPTASFFAALSTASSLRLAVVACLAGPPGCTRRPAHHPIPAQVRKRHEGQDDIFKACPPESLAGLGGVEVRTKLKPGPPLRGASVDQNPVFTRLCRPYD